jgi:O-antigen/teichoic acid export membrane protein
MSAQMALQGLRVVQQILLVPFYLKAWGVETYNDWLLIGAGVSLIGIFDTGTQPYFSGLLQETFVRGDLAAFSRAARTAAFNYLMIVLTVVLAFALSYFAVDWLTVLGIARMDGSQAYWTLGLLALNALLLLPFGVAGSLYRVHGEYDRGVRVNFVIFSLQVVVPLGLLATGQPSPVLALGLVGCTVAGWGIVLVDHRLRYGPLPWGLAVPTAAELRTTMAKCLYFLAQPITTWLTVQGPLLLLGHMASPAATVSFATARTLVGVSRQLTVQLALPFSFEISVLLNREEMPAIRRVLRSAVSIIALIGGMLSGATIATGPAVARLWLKGRIDIPPVLILALAGPVVIAASAQLYQLILGLANRPRPIAWGVSIQALVGLSVGALLAPAYGAVGVAIGLAIGEILGIVTFLQLRTLRSFAMPGASLMVIGILRAAVAAALSYGIARGIGVLLPPDDYVRLIAFGALWSLVCGGAAFLVLLDSDQRAVLLRHAPWARA